MKLSETTLTDVLTAFRAPTPTPGGGSAAALAGALGASLLAMVAGLPKTRTATEADIQRLRDALSLCSDYARRLEALVDRTPTPTSPSSAPTGCRRRATRTSRHARRGSRKR